MLQIKEKRKKKSIERSITAWFYDACLYIDRKRKKKEKKEERHFFEVLDHRSKEGTIFTYGSKEKFSRNLSIVYL